MTGRRLYDHFTDAAKQADQTGYHRNITDLPGGGHLRKESGTHGPALAPLAWPYLTQHDQRLWNIMAKKVTPKRRVQA